MWVLMTRGVAESPANASEENPEHVFSVKYTLIRVEWGKFHNILGVASLPPYAKARV